AAAALNPKPRDFTDGEGWKNGRKPSDVFQTVTEGLGGMPSFASLPVDDRWALAHYVLSIGPAFPKDSTADLKTVGVDLSKPNGGLGGAAKSESPVDLAIEILSEEK